MNKLFESAKIILMCELCKEWLEFKKEDIKESTYIKYRNIILNHINPHIGGAYIHRLSNPPKVTGQRKQGKNQNTDYRAKKPKLQKNYSDSCFFDRAFKANKTRKPMRLFSDVR